MKADEFLFASDAGRLLNVSAQTIRIWEERGELRVAGRTPNGTRLFMAADVRKLAEKRQARQSE